MMKRSLQFKRPLNILRPTAVALALALGGAPVLWAQSAPSGEISDKERAKRDASKVFSFIKFHAVKPAGAAAPKPAAPAPAPRPTPRSEAVAAAPVAGPAVPSAAPSAAPSVANAPTTLPPVSEPAPVPAPAPVATATESPPAPATATAVEEEDDDPGIRLIKYVAPELSARAVAAITGTKSKVRVRFTVMPDGSAAKVMALGSAPRAVAQVAVRAVEQWRFEGVKEPQEVEVEVDFNLAE